MEEEASDFYNKLRQVEAMKLQPDTRKELSQSRVIHIDLVLNISILRYKVQVSSDKKWNPLRQQQFFHQ